MARSRLAGAAEMGAVARLRVLLAEDEAIIAMALQDALEMAGHHVTLAADGAAALAALGDCASFDALVTDLNRPGRDGEALVRQARAARPPLPVVVVTGSPPRDGAHELRRGGAGPPVVMLVKPVAADDVLRALGQVVASGAGAAPMA